MLVQKGRIIISGNTNEWFKQALTAPSISIIAISTEITIESTILPGEFHGDPAEPLIVASARVQATLVIHSMQGWGL